MSAALYMGQYSTASVRRNPLSQKVEAGVNSLMFVILLLVALISLVFLANANRNATNGYALKNLEFKRTHLMTENEVLDMEIARVQALDNIQNDPKVQRMVKANEPLYVRGDTAIAAK